MDKEGTYAAYRAYDTERSVVLVSELGHFSLKKAGGILGIGSRNIISIGLDRAYRLDIKSLKEKIDELKKSRTRTKIIAIVGIAGTTETGTVDPLRQIGEICAENVIHFHVDAAWGGPVLFSEKYNHLLDGIELADSVTIDGHKQFYMPMSSGMIYFKDPCRMDAIIYHASYVNRPGSVDLGIKSLSGSREANSLILDSALKIMGSGGYALLIEHGIETAKSFAEEIVRRPDFELVTPPELNILTYRICPKELKSELAGSVDMQRKAINERLNEINITVQRLQREAGKSFVSRTTLKTYKGRCESIVVLRCVIMNPLTDINILKDILDEQEELYRQSF